MKILYVGTDRRSAEAVGTALRGIAHNVAASWAHTLDHTVTWLEENQDAEALVVDAQIHAGEWPSSLKQLRSLPLRPAVVVVVPEGTQPKFESLGPPADGYVTMGDTFVRDLPVAVTSAVTRVRGPQPSPPASSDIVEPQQRLEFSRERAAGRGRWKKAFRKVRRAEPLSIAPQSVDQADQLADLVAAKSALEHRLAEVEAASLKREQIWSAERTAAAERQDYLDALVQLERMARTDLEQELENATAALHDAQQRRAVELAATRDAHERAVTEQLTELQHELQAALAQEVEKRREVEAMLAEVLSARADAEKLALTGHEGESHLEGDAELVKQIQHERALRAGLEHAVAESNATLNEAQLRHSAAIATAATELARRQAQFDRQLSQTAADRDRLDARLNQAECALDQARREYQSASVDVERLQQREAELSAKLADVEAIHQDLNRQLAEAATAADQAGHRQAELVGQLHHERMVRASLEQAVVDMEANLRDTRQQHDAAVAAATGELAEHRAHFDREISNVAADRDSLRQQLKEREAALDQVRDAHQSAAADVDRLTQREADLTAQLADVTSVRNSLERELAAVQAAADDADSRAKREHLEISTRAAAREAKLDDQIRRERAARATLERTVADANASLRDAEQRHEAALAKAARELDAEKAYFDREWSALSAERNGLKQQLHEREVALDQARSAHQSVAADVDHLTLRKAELTAQLADLQASHQKLEERLAEATDLEAQLAHEIEARKTLEQTLTETRTAAIDAERRFRMEADALRTQAAEREAEFEALRASEQRDHESRVSEMRQECDRLGQARAAADADVQRLHADLSETKHVLEDTRRVFQETLDRLSTEHATTLAALNASVAERDEWLKEQAMRHDLALQASERERVEVRERLQVALAARRDEIEHVQEKLMAMVKALETAKRRPDVSPSEHHAELAVVRRTQGGALAST